MQIIMKNILLTPGRKCNRSPDIKLYSKPRTAGVFQGITWVLAGDSSKYKNPLP